MQAWSIAEDVLRQGDWVTRALESRRAIGRLLAVLIVLGLFYGAIMGSYRLLAGQAGWELQIAYSAVKVPLLLMGSFLISLPSFFVINTLLGLRHDFGAAVRALLAAQAGLAILLASLAPLTMLWYASTARHNEALLFNGLMFAVASFGAQVLVRGYYRPLIAANKRHRWLLWCWLFVYALVAIQLAWLLRPFVGAPGSSVVFVRPEAWDNAYVIVGRLILNTLFR